jgi:hypothetical protein
MSPLLGTLGGLSARAYGFGNSVVPSYAIGAYDSLATVTLSATASSITFAGIPSGYKHLQIRCFANITTADAAGLQFNGDTTSSYNAHRLYGTGTAAGGAASSGGASVTSIGLPATAGFPSATSTFGISIIDILDYQNVNKYKTVRGLSAWDGNGSGYVDFGSGLWRNTNAITSITYSAASGNFIANSSFALYGVK